MKRIAVMTSGGDAPGMNAAVRAVVRAGLDRHVEVYGIRQAYQGLLAGDMALLTSREVSGILQRGGTVLQTARNDEFKTANGQRKGKRRLNEHGIEGVIVIGGDGSMRGALALHNMDVPVIGIPASIDNDIWGTDTSIGVDTALNTILDAVDRLRDTATSHNRAFVIEVMGRDCGYLAVMGGILGGAEIVVTPENGVTMNEDRRCAGRRLYPRQVACHSHIGGRRALSRTGTGGLFAAEAHRLRDPPDDIGAYTARRQPHCL